MNNAYVDFPKSKQGIGKGGHYENSKANLKTRIQSPLRISASINRPHPINRKNSIKNNDSQDKNLMYTKTFF